MQQSQNTTLAPTDAAAGTVQTELLDVMVIGAGLAGLTAAVVCSASGLNVRILEAQPRIGGRVHSLYRQSNDELINNTQFADLGPTWVWAKYQPVVQQWLTSLDIELMPQFETGQGMLDRHQDKNAEPWSLPGQDGMTRIHGGPQSIVNGLVSRLAQNAIETNSPVEHITAESEHLSIKSQDKLYRARYVIVATPLPITANSITFTPALPDNMMQQLQLTTTWMAQQAKVLIQYPKAFWREQGLSGRIASQVGPLVEVHDHSDDKGNDAALFGFMGVPAELREKHRAELKEAIRTQLIRVFGDIAANPTEIHIEDWACNKWICTEAEKASGGQHPSVLPEFVRKPYFDDRLRFAVSETSVISPGLIEGALHAGASVAQRIVEHTDQA